MDGAERITAASPLAVPTSRWSDAEAAGKSDAELLLYRSNLLGADLAITNFGGGNTSAKIDARDPVTGASVETLWVKGSGGDLGSMGLDGFSVLDLSRLRALESRYPGPEAEDDMVGLLAHCAFGPGGRAASIDTPLHAALPYRHIDHVHPDAVIALACAKDGAGATRSIFGTEVGWLPWRRPGFELAVQLRALSASAPLRGVVLAGHGLIAWGESAKACYENTLELISRAAAHLNALLAGRPAFGGAVVAAEGAGARASLAGRLAPRLRAAAGGDKVLHFDDAPEVLEFVGGADAARLAALGTSCPDHFLRTKARPLLLDAGRLDDDAYLGGAFDDYRRGYQAYHERHRTAETPPVRDANPVIVLAPGVGLFALAKDKIAARIASEFYRNAINVMRGAEALGGYVGLDEAEVFRVEYWALEEAKLRRAPPAPPLQGKVALITGGAGGIGRAAARRLAADGACVMLADVDGAALTEALGELQAEFGADNLRQAHMDVTSEASVAAGFAALAREYGGLDILVANAGLASSAAIEDTTLEEWRRNHSVLADGYFLAARAAFPLLRASGGAIVFVGSKNALAATPNAAAYASAKAAALHLARCLALEGAPFGIRVNVVNPDAVIRGSRIWSGNWRRERAEAHGVEPGAELEAHYRERSLLKREVLPEDVAEAIAFFVSDKSSKSTGNILNVDAGNAQAFTR